MNAKHLLNGAVLAFAAILSLSKAAPAAEITGRVLIAGKPTAAVVISIEGLKVEGAPDTTLYVIDHRDLNFVPHVLVVRAGTTVQFKNSDGMPCRIYSISPAGIFVLSRQDSKPVSVKFDRPAVIEIRCADHSRIHAYLIVKDNSYFALTDDKGNYRISDVPPGRYTLQAWYEGAPIKHRTVAVRAGKLTVDFRASRIQRKEIAGKAFQPSTLGSSAELLPAGGLPASASSWRNQQ